MNDYLQARPDDVLKVLNSLGLPNLSHNRGRNEIRYSSRVGGNPTSNIFYLDTLRYYSFSMGESGNLYTLVMNNQNCNFPQALEYVAQVVGLSKNEFNTEIKLPFGGFYKKLIKQQREPELDIPTYPDSLLEEYNGQLSLQFFNDGINFQTQEKYHIGVDFSAMRIAIPQWTINGQLCGIMGRAMGKDVPHEERWLPIIPCTKSYTLFGYHQNYHKIQEKNMCIVFESEKAVCQLDSFGCYIGLATGGCHISSTQAKYLRALRVEKIIIAYDEGLDEEHIIAQAQRLCSNENQLVRGAKIGYIWDENNTYLPLGSKMNAADVGKEKFIKLIKEKVRWLE